MIWLKNLLGQLLIGTAFAVLSISSANAVSTDVVPGSKAAGLENCVAETGDMRRNHMDYLMHKRDKTMRQGIRTLDFSLNECVACHAGKDSQGQFVPVDDQDQFCQACHVRVAEKLDCFQCHRTTPESHQ